jgi:uncharacterized protein (TIGR02147 family)
MVFQASTYRDFLKSTLSGSSGEREGCSMTALSRKIGVSTSFLSEVLSAKKSLSVELAFRIAVKLNLTDLETQYFCLLVQLDQETDPVFREELGKRLSAINPERAGHDLSVDLFRIIADWYHFAILELTYLPGFRLDAAFIAGRLGITKLEAQAAIERLLRLELLEAQPDGRARKVHSYLVSESRVPNRALRNCHKQVLQKAIEALEAQTPEDRLSATDIVPMDSRYLPRIEQLSREFSSAVMRLSERSRTKDSVYAVAVHAFRLTQKDGNGAAERKTV